MSRIGVNNRFKANLLVLGNSGTNETSHATASETAEATVSGSIAHALERAHEIAVGTKAHSERHWTSIAHARNGTEVRSGRAKVVIVVGAGLLNRDGESGG